MEATDQGAALLPGLVRAALSRVLDGDTGAGMSDVHLRSDTVLADLGVDELARVLLVDACADRGVVVDAQAAWTARTVGDLVDAAQMADTPGKPVEP